MEFFKSLAFVANVEYYVLVSLFISILYREIVENAIC